VALTGLSQVYPSFCPLFKHGIGAVLSTLAFLRRLAIRLLATFYGNGIRRLPGNELRNVAARNDMRLVLNCPWPLGESFCN